MAMRMPPIHLIIRRFHVSKVYKLLTVLAVIVLALFSSAKAQSAPQCSTVFIEMTPPVSLKEGDEWQAASIISLRARSFPKKRQYYDENFYERNFKIYEESDRTLLYDALYLPKFLNTRAYRQGSLTAPIVASYVERVPERVEWFRESGSIMPSRALMRQAPMMTFIWRGSGNEALFPNKIISSTGIPGGADGFKNTATDVKAMIGSSLDRLYSDFAAQGPERKILVPIVQEQDRRDLDRTIHFEIGFHIDNKMTGTGHLQVMTSQSSKEPLHFEEQWGHVDRQPGENIGEVGRFYIGREDTSNSTRDRKELMRSLLWQQMLSWANHDVKLDRLFFQVNDRVRGVLKGYGIPVDQAKARRVSQVINGEKREEWIFELDRPTMLLAEQQMMGRILNRRLSDYLAAGKHTQPGAEGGLALQFSRNEIWSLIDMGLVKVDNSPTPQGFEKPISWRSYGDSEAVLYSVREPVFHISQERLNAADSFYLVIEEKMIPEIIENKLKRFMQ